MDPATIVTLIPAVTSGIRAGVVALTALKKEVQALFERGEIDSITQQALLDDIDDIFQTHEAAEVPAHWQKRPNPEVAE